MPGLQVPERGEDFTADPVELFLDLGYVLAFSQLGGLLVADPGWATVGRAALLFTLMWLPWSQFTWSANAVSGRGRVMRLLFLLATAASVLMAASVPSAFGRGGPAFALSLAAISVIAFTTTALGAEPVPGGRRPLARLAPPALPLALLLAGAASGGGLRVAAWVAALAVIALTVAVTRRDEWLVRPGHLAERHGLIILVALGEVVVGVGTPVLASLGAGAGLPGPTAGALVAAGLFAGLLWWAYFDGPAPALEERAGDLDRDAGQGHFAREVYTGGHAVVVAGIILAAAALESVAVHPGEPLALPFRVMLAAGLALALMGTTTAVWRALRGLAVERMVVAGAVALLLALGEGLAGVVLLAAVDLLLVAGLAAEHLRGRGPAVARGTGEEHPAVPLP